MAKDPKIKVSVDDKATKPLKDIEGGLKRTAGQAKVFAAGLAASGAVLVGATKKTLDFANEFSKMGDQIAKTSDRLGLTTDSLQELRFAFDRTGVGADQGTQALEKLTRGLGEAQRGTGEALKSLQMLSSVTGRDLTEAGLKSDDALRLIADGFQKIEDPAVKAKMATDLFGRSGVAMVNVLNEGSDGIDAYANKLRDMGGVMDEDALRKSEELQDALTDLAKVTDAFKSEVFVAFADDVISMVGAMGDTMRDSNITELLGGLGSTIMTTAEFWINAAGDIVNAANDIIGAVAKVAKFTPAGFILDKTTNLFKSDADQRGFDLDEWVKSQQPKLKEANAKMRSAKVATAQLPSGGGSSGSDQPKAGMTRDEFAELSEQFDIDMDQMKEIYSMKIVEAWEYLEELRINQVWKDYENEQKINDEMNEERLNEMKLAQEKMNELNKSSRDQNLADVQAQLEQERALRQAQLDSFNNASSTIVAAAQGMAGIVEGEAGRVLNTFASMMQSIMQIVNSAAGGSPAGIIAGGFGLLGGFLGLTKSSPVRRESAPAMSSTTNITVNATRVSPRDLRELEARASRTAAPRASYAY